jgi:hypothetical protein
MNTRFEVTDITGKITISDAVPLSFDALASFQTLFENFDDLSHLSVTVDPDTVYFNPKYIVSVKVVLDDR